MMLWFLTAATIFLVLQSSRVGDDDHNTSVRGTNYLKTLAELKTVMMRKNISILPVSQPESTTDTTNMVHVT